MYSLLQELNKSHSSDALLTHHSLTQTFLLCLEFLSLLNKRKQLLSVVVRN